MTTDEISAHVRTVVHAELGRLLAPLQARIRRLEEEVFGKRPGPNGLTARLAKLRTQLDELQSESRGGIDALQSRLSRAIEVLVQLETIVEALSPTPRTMTAGGSGIAGE